MANAEKRDGPRRTLGAVSASLHGAPPAERKRLKRDALLAVAKPPRFSGHGVEIEILSVSPFGDDGIEIDARVYRGGAPVPLGNRLPFRIVNPPIMVPDGTKSTVDVPFGGGTRASEVDNLREDTGAALRAIVAEHVRSATR